MDNLVIIGTSTTSIQVYEFIKEYQLYNVIGFSVDEQYIKSDNFLGLPVFPLGTLNEYIDIDVDFVFVAILWDKLNANRRMVYERLKSKGYKFANIISPTSKIRGTLLGDNCWLNDYSIISSGVTIGSNVIVRPYVLIGENTIIEDHCFCGDHSIIAGGVKIGRQSFIGINATIFDDRTVGEKCIIGACAVVKRNLPDFSICKTGIENSIIIQLDENSIEEKLRFSKNKK